jgi:hypothetical protein
MALEGQTPARKAGLEFNSNNKWMDLLRNAVKI